MHTHPWSWLRPLLRAAMIGLAASTFVGVAVCAVVASGGAAPGAQTTTQPTHTAPITFNRDIAPIIYRNCAPCHRPGQSAPFNLLSYEEVKKKAKLIGEVTERRYMPPWLPEHGYGQFAGERWLSVDDIGLIKQWHAEGAVEGKASDLPTLPKWPEGWELGRPDLTVTLSSDYLLAPEGRDTSGRTAAPSTGRNPAWPGRLRQSAPSSARLQGRIQLIKNAIPLASSD